jgi:type I restriction enzyme, S subunit
MNAELLLAHFDRISDAPGAALRLRRFILDLAVRGKLVEQSSVDHSSNDSLGFRISSNLQKQEGVPRGWFAGTVGDFLDFQYGKGLPASERKDSGLVPVFGSNGVVGYCSQALSEKSTVIIGRKGSAGALNLCEGPSWTTDVAYFVEPPEFFNIRYLYFALHTLDLDTLGKGVKPGLSRNDAYQLDLCVPPLVEQHLIVAKVDELMALCDRLEGAQRERESRRDQLTASTHHHLNNGAGAETLRSQAEFFIGHLPRLTARPDQIKQLRQSILNLAVRGKLVHQDSSDKSVVELITKIRHEQDSLIKKGIIPKRKATKQDGAKSTHSEFPPSWANVEFSSLCNIITSGSRGWAEYYADKGPRFIRAQNIRFGRLRLDDLANVNPPNSSEGTRTKVSKGDLLIVITGAGVTNPALLEQDIGEAYVSQHVALIKPTNTDLSSWLLLFLMAEHGGRAELVERAYGAGKPGLNLDNIRSLSTPVPPLAEQQRVVAKVDELMTLCDQLESHLAATQTEASRLLESVLHQALQTPA